MEKHLHIISLTVPYPVDYGGVYDLFYKLPALQQQGVQVHLHCFDYGRGQQPELNKYCASVNYYQRATGSKGVAANLPYIVSSRKNENLALRLLQDDYPILMEGIHCTYLLNDSRFDNRRKFVRLHNVEYEYYKSLRAGSSNLLSKIYFAQESRMLKKYEYSIACKANAFFAVAPADKETYQNKLSCKSAYFLPLFLPAEWQSRQTTGIGTYCLYHGDLSVQMNERAAVWLIQKVFAQLSMPLVIAGKNPSKKLQKLADRYEQACLVADPAESIMQDIISKAHINILPSFSATGIKIKLLNALFNGRHCLVNSPTALGSGLESLCHIADSAAAIKQRIEILYQQPFTQQESDARKTVLCQMFCNNANAEKLVSYIWQ